MRMTKHLGLCRALVTKLAIVTIGILANPVISMAALNTIDLAGSWQFQPTTLASVNPKSTPREGEAWQAIHVPDNWYRQEKDISGYAWYQRQFDIHPALAGKQIRLVFDGVDYTADVWLNGKYLGHHEGYSQSFDFDVTDHVHKGKNELRVLVNSPLEKSQDWSLHKRLLKGIFSHHDTRPGGAWSERGQEQNTGGIWAPVRLEISDGIAIRRVKVTPQKQEGDAWNVHSEIALDIRHGKDSAMPGSAGSKPELSEFQVEATVTPENFNGKPQTFRQERKIEAGQSTLFLDIPISQPQLWWPAGHGKPNLYRLKLTITQAGKVIDQRDSVFGFRQVQMDAPTEQWLVNGRRLFVRGTNYISSQWLAEMTPQRYERDIGLIKNANMNAIRVHAHIEAPAFYEACDRNGMLVLQDYMLQWGYSDDETFTREARRQAADMVNALANHPSIAVWSLHNEPPWDSPWMKDKYQGYNPDQNRMLDDVLYQDIAALDTSRIVRKVSTTKEHPWIGWYFGQWQEFAAPAAAPWVTEFGAQALPSLAGLKKIFKPEALWPDTEEKWKLWEFHNFQRHETFDIARVQQGSTIQEFIANTQAYQAKLTQFAAESYRRQRYAPMTALFQFMFNEDWPSVNWGIVDYWREPKAGYEALKTAYQPVLPSIEWSRESYQPGEVATVWLWVINDLWQSFPQSQYQVSVVKNGRVVTNKAIKLDIAEDSGRKLEALNIEQLETGEYAVRVKIVAADGKMLGQNQYIFTVAP